MGQLLQAVRKLLEAELPGLRRVETQSLHRGVAGARHGFLEVPAGSNKLDMLRQARCYQCCQTDIYSSNQHL